MARKLNFRELIDEVRYRGRSDCTPPRPMSQIAKRCGMSRQHLYNICEGRKYPPSWTVNRIAKALGFDPAVVQKAIDLSRELAELA